VRAQIEPEALIDEPLDHPDRNLRSLGELAGQGLGDVLQLSVRHHALHDAEPVGFGGFDEVGGPE
jgi:hypothetical protein